MIASKVKVHDALQGASALYVALLGHRQLRLETNISCSEKQYQMICLAS